LITISEAELATHLTLIGDWFYYFRRVPSHLKPYDGRKFIRMSLKTKNRREAERAAGIHDDFIEQYWADLVRTGSGDRNLSRYRRARQMARAHGFAYRNIAEVAGQPVEEILARVEALGGSGSKMQREALLGGVDAPETRLSESLELYWPLIDDRLTEKSNHQARKYKVPRQTAFETFISVVGDKPLAGIERGDVLKFKSYLMQRIADKDLAGNSANKQLAAVKDILVAVGRDLEIETEFEPLFSGTRFKSPKRSRPPFEAYHVRDVFLRGPVLGKLNMEARLLMLMMIETGARPSELIGLLPEEYVLDAEIPHIWIKKNSLRSLKVGTTERRIPLVGVALEAAKRIAPTGLTRYQAKPDHASGAINKFLRENDLLPSDEHSLYSIRHTFKDRLRDVQAPEEIINELMGHNQPGPRYGRGRLLVQKHEWLKRIAFKEAVVLYRDRKHSCRRKQALSRGLFL